ncbi:MAG TPA: nicotinate phosphoribosyltransferase [Candidatus Omnitrophota bacterium]|nr:nicotinate phosphoribosyltransferase [Candidatus Omnitrophota bacterium]
MKQPFLKEFSPLYTDFYQLTMAEGYFLTGLFRQKAVFDLYYRKNPFQGGYLIAAGMDEAVRLLSKFRFTKSDLNYLKEHGFKQSFLNYLKTFRFGLNVQSVREGEIVFPHEPLMRIEGSILEAQLVETLLINFVHFSSLVATKASRIVQAASGRKVVEFGLRRAQGLAGIMASRAAYIGGVDGTSNVLAAKTYDLPIFGTQAHSWIQAFRNEEKSFWEYARIHKEKTVLLIDTYSTLQSGLPHLIRCLKRLRKKQIEIHGVRLDSGDLAYLSKEVRRVLDVEGFPRVQIFASGQLDEYIIESLLKQKASLNGFGVGTKLVTAYDEPALDMVYKLSEINCQPEIKISDTLSKMNEPGKKKVFRFFAKDGQFFLDGIALEHEKTPPKLIHPFNSMAHTKTKGLKAEPLFHALMKKGKVVAGKVPVREIREYAKKRLVLLPEEHKRFFYPHIYRVGVSKKLFDLKEKMILKRLGAK